MDNISPVDYHIEVTELKDFVNEQIETGNLGSIQGMVVFRGLKDAFIGASVKPFLIAPAKGESDSYYEKYYGIEKHTEYAEKYIPGFFSLNRDYYDLDSILNIYKNKIASESFKILFLLKLYQLECIGASIDKFLDFQVHDNFYGYKEDLADYLYQYLKNDGIFHLLPKTLSIINQWGNKEENGGGTIETNQNKTKEKYNDETGDSLNKSIDNDNVGIEIKGRFSIEEIRKYFSFLYEERSAHKKPFLRKEEVEEMFNNGFTVPADPMDAKYKLNVTPQYPRSIIDFAIHQCYMFNSNNHKDKKLYLQFFGSYIENYQAAVESPKTLNSLLSNFSVIKSGRNKIKWENYLSEKFKN